MTLKILKTEHLVPYILLIIFFIPWSLFGFEQFETKIKEVVVLCVALLFFIKHLMGKKLHIDFLGKVYFYFILVCIFYTFVELTYPKTQEEIYFVIHVLLFTILNFIIYFLVFNSNLNNFDYKKFINLIVLIYLCLFVYFVSYAIEIHNLGQYHIGGFYSVENQLWQEGKIINYLGGTNSRSWFFLILSSFLVGYYRSRKLFIPALLTILMSIFVSYLMLSRGATLFGVILLVIYLLSLFNFKNLKPFTLFVFLSLSSLLVLTITNTSTENSIITKAFENKKGYNNRDKLVLDSIKLITNDFFVGRGFHYTHMNKKELKEEGYKALGHNNTQNTLLSIFVELGILGISLYMTFWILLYIKITRIIKYSSFHLEKSYFCGIKLMIIFLFFSSMFSHFIEKSFTTTPILMTLIALAVKLNYQKKNFEN